MKPYLKANDLIRWAEDKLGRAGVGSPEVDALLLLSDASGLKRDRLFLENPSINRLSSVIFKHNVRLRAKRYPLQYIVEGSEFLGLPLKLQRGLFIPRHETELLVLETIKVAKEIKKDRLNVMEIGSGSGNISISLTKNVTNCRIIACDISWRAICTARSNARANGVGHRIKFVKSNLFSNISQDLINTFDIIISNPPYVKRSELKLLEPELRYEDKRALDGGSDGMDFYRRILKDGSRFLKIGGFFVFEIGALQRRELVTILADYPQFGNIKFVSDYGGYDRIAIIKKV